MSTHATHKFWLKISALVIGGFGPILTLGTMPMFNEPARWGLDVLTWPIDGFPSYQAPEMWFLSALTGGFLVGWGVMVWCLSLWVYDAAPEAVRRTLMISGLCWFTFDSFGSIASGHWPNALWNVLFLLFAIGPMWWPATPETAQKGDR